MTIALSFEKLIIFLVIYLPSLYFFTKYFQVRGVLYFVIFIISIFSGLKFYYHKPALFLKLSKAFLALVCLILIFVVLNVYPSLNQYQQALKIGSDRDEALILAVTNLLRGTNPYQEKTYLGNPISPLPGSVILAIPFVLLSGIQFQNIFWLGILIFSIYWLTKNKSNVILFALFLFLNPLIWWEIIIVSDYLANSLFYFVFIIILLFKKPADNRLQNILLIIFGTLVLCSRFIFWLPLPFIGWYLWNKKNFTYLRVLIASFLLNLLIIALCIYLVGSANFSPLHITNFLSLNIKGFNLLNAIMLLAVLGIIALVIVKKKKGTLVKQQFTDYLSNKAELLKIIGSIFLLCSLSLALVRKDLYFFIYSTPAIVFLASYTAIEGVFPGDASLNYLNKKQKIGNI